MDPGPFQNLPSNVEAEIKSSTAFGAKYVDLIVPPEASSEPLQSGAVLHSRNVTVEVNTVFENLQSVVHSIDPAKLNAVLSAVAESVRGKGDRIGQAITDANNVLLAVNPRMPTVQQDWQLFGQTAASVFGCGAEHPVDSRLVLDHQQDDHHACEVARRAAALRGRILSIGHQHDRRKPAKPGARDEHPRSDDRAVDEIFAHLHVPVSGRPVVPGPRRPRCIGRQWKICHHGCRAVVRRRSVPLSRQPADRQRQGRSRRQAELRFAARCQQELPGEVPGHRHRVRHRPRHPAQPRHRVPRLRQLLPRHQSNAGTAEDPLPRRPGAGSVAGLPRRTSIRCAGVRAGRNAALPAAARRARRPPEPLPAPPAPPEGQP